MIRPLNGYVLLEPEKGKDTLDSGIVLRQELPEYWGKVISFGGGVVTKSGMEVCPVGVGDVVLYDNYRAEEVEKLKLVPFNALKVVRDE